MAAHLRIRKTTARITKHFYWPGCLSEIEDFCQTYHECQIQGRHNNAKVCLVTVPLIDVPFSRVAIDIIGPMPTTDNENAYILTMIDLD